MSRAHELANSLECTDTPGRFRYEAAELLRDQYAAIERLTEENERLRSVMIAAAEEIHAHWDAHCDAEGYGPANLMRRLEDGIPAQYGYTAGAFATLTAERDEALSMVRKWEAKAATWLASPEAAQRLDGYRELAQRGNLAEAERDALLRTLKFCEGVLNEVRPCADPECKQDQEEYIQMALSKIDAARKEQQP